MRGRIPPAILILAGAITLIEGAFQLSDVGLLPQGLRWAGYRDFAFFDAYFEAARGGGSTPPAFYWSLLTHTLLHGGLLHYAMNTAVLLAIGRHVCGAVGQGATLLMFFGTAAAGALAFGALADTGGFPVPMVGASGGLFGLLGAMKRWEWRFLGERGLSKRRFWNTMLALAAINLLLSLGFAADGGGVAWEAHLGGFAAGWLAAGALSPRPGTWIGPI